PARRRRPRRVRRAARAAARRPAARPRRLPLGGCRTRGYGPSASRARRSWVPLHGQAQKVRRAGDAGVVAADDALAALRRLLVRPVQEAGSEGPQVLLDPPLVLGGRRDDLRLLDEPVRAHLVAVVEEP